MSINVRKGIYSKLTGASAVTSLVGARIYHQQAPPSADFPFIIFSKSAGTKVRAMQTPESVRRDTWLVKAVDRNTTANLADAIAGAIDSTLDGGTLTVEGKSVIDLYHVGDVEYIEDDGDQQYRHAGASYSLVLT